MSRTSESEPVLFRARGFFGFATVGFAAGYRRSRVAYAQECSDGEPVRCVPVNAGKLLDQAIRTLKASPSIDHWQKHRERWEAEELLMHVLGGDPDPRDEVSPKDRRRFEAMVERRATGEPIPFIKGYAEFRGIELIAQPGVFVPRDSSEFLAEQAVRRLRKRRRRWRSTWRRAAARSRWRWRTRFRRPRCTAPTSRRTRSSSRGRTRSGWACASSSAGATCSVLYRRSSAVSVDVITLHPPYVASGEIEDLPDEIREWEPVHTLTDRSDDGLGLDPTDGRRGARSG